MRNPNNKKIREVLDGEDTREKMVLLKRAIMIKFGMKEEEYTAAFSLIMKAINRSGSNDKKKKVKKALREEGGRRGRS